jgi:hypothetical protein
MCQEFFDMGNAGQWLVLPYKAIRHLPGLRLSPTGFFPNANTDPVSLWTILTLVSILVPIHKRQIPFNLGLHSPASCTSYNVRKKGTIWLAKTDVTDAFMRVWISPPTLPTLGAVLPSYPNEEPIIAFPMILPMGWIDSPNYLCAFTDTIANLANALQSQQSLRR